MTMRIKNWLASWLPEHTMRMWAGLPPAQCLWPEKYIKKD